MGNLIPIHGKKHFNDTASGVTEAFVTRGTPSATNARIFVTDVNASSNKEGALLTVRSGGTPSATILFQVQIQGSGTPMAFGQSFQTPLIGTAGTKVTITIDGDSACKVNMSGFIA